MADELLPIPEEFAGEARPVTVDPGGEGPGWGGGGSKADAKRSQVQWGRDVKVSPQATTAIVNWQNLVMTPEREVATDWMIDVVPAAIPGTGALNIQITYTLGGSTFTKGPHPLLSLGGERFHVTGRRVQIDVSWTSGIVTATPIVVTGGAAEGGVADSPLDFYLARWTTSLRTQASQTLAGPAPGRLMAYQAELTVMSSDPLLYIVWVDTLNPVSGVTPTFWNSPPFKAAGDWFAFGEDEDEKIGWNTYCTWILSSTPDIYTAPSGTAPSCHVRNKLGL